MKKILVLGAGRSSSSLIAYLLANAKQEDWHITIGDISEKAAEERLSASPHGKAIHFDVHDEALSKSIIGNADIVISLLPAHLHLQVAKYCLAFRKHFLNASYVSEELKSLHDDALGANLLFMNECGLDPGIDHMSAMQLINKIKNIGGLITSFESFTGGLIAAQTHPENPWRYKFTWNPRNVVMAGQGTAKYLKDGQYKYVPYQQLFKRVIPVKVSEILFEGYPNRDSLKYVGTYGLHDIKTMIRGTLRNAGYCSAWNIFVQLGCCDDTYKMEGVEDMTHADFIGSFIEIPTEISVEERICQMFQLTIGSAELQRLRWSGFFSNEKIGLTKGTPAQILEHILAKKWKLVPGDKDYIVMWHRLGYLLNGEKKKMLMSLEVEGENEIETAMSKTVGLPLGIVTKLLLQDKIKQRGVVIPIAQEVYDPVLLELGELGIKLTESEM